MRIKTITYQKVKNLGNYESERLEMSAELDEEEDSYIVAAQLRSRVNYLLDVPTAKEPEQESEDGF